MKIKANVTVLLITSIYLFLIRCNKKEVTKFTTIDYDSLQIEVSFVDDIMHPGQTIVINTNKNFKHKHQSMGNIIEIALPDTSVMREVYFLTRQSQDTVYSREAIEERWRFFLKLETKGKETSEMYLINNKLSGYNYLRRLYCILQKEQVSSTLSKERNLGTVRSLLSFINTKYIRGKAYLDNAFELDTFCEGGITFHLDSVKRSNK